MTAKQLADAILSGAETPAILDEAETVMVLAEIRDRCRITPSSAGETGRLAADLAAATQRADSAEAELAKLRTENAKLKAKDADFENRVHLRAAQELVRVGIRESSVASSLPTSKPPTMTEICLAEKARMAATAPVHQPVPPASQSVDDGDEE
ncbi:MAG: hypothetical protein J0M24_10715 [Verrucomicrobia bacterium]|nr:hypothetical protein [Verrucomicrobiota bacterium]